VTWAAGPQASERLTALGTLEVQILRATNLVSADDNGFSDPYVALKVHKQKTWKSKVMYKTLNPEWNEVYRTPTSVRLQEIIGAPMQLKVMDKDSFSKDDHIGEKAISLQELEHKDRLELKNLRLEKAKTGTIDLIISWRKEPLAI